MRRQVRLDAPGALHHVMIRGIEGNRFLVITGTGSRGFAGGDREGRGGVHLGHRQYCSKNERRVYKCKFSTMFP
jgi:hypothetical protein